MKGLGAHCGYSLIELLVAMLVIAVGALGAVGLQIASSENNRGALERTVALMLAEDMVERLHANGGAGYTASLGTGPPAWVDCRARDCAPAELAVFDLAVWKCALGRWNDESVCVAVRTAGLLAAEERQPGLPEGDGGVAVEADGRFAVTVTWRSGRVGRLAVAGRR